MSTQVALVTGGMGGIGTAICKRLADQGAKVIAAYNRSDQSAEEWRKQQQKEGYEFAIGKVDIADYPSCTHFIDKLNDQFGHIDILVNNAGITRDVQFYKMSHEAWQTVMRTNLDSIFNITRPVICGMIEQKFGRIVNVSSINGQKGQFGQTNYSASKAGIHGFTKSLAQEVARKGITVNTISPGYIDTQMIRCVPEEIREKIIGEIPVGRFGTALEIAEAVVYLVGKNSGFITGSNLVINGGQYLL